MLTFENFMSEIPKSVRLAYKLFSWTWWITHNERYNEIKGIVAAIGSDKLSLSDTILINSLYELESWCTSIVAM